MKSRSLFSAVLIFGAGFLVGVLFSAWKLDTVTGTQGGVPHGSGMPPGMPPGMSSQMPPGPSPEALDRMLAAKPDDLGTMVEVANGYFDLRDFQKAEKLYNKALKLAPKNTDVLVDLGVTLRRMGKPKEAAEKFKEALKVNPDHAVAMFNLGIVLRDDLNDLPGALKIWEAFLDKAGNSPHAVMVRPWVKQLRSKIEAAGKQGKE